jgi:hypothetical protein
LVPAFGLAAFAMLMPMTAIFDKPIIRS